MSWAWPSPAWRCCCWCRRGGPLTVAVDDSLFRRCGRTVHGAGWQYDGPAPARRKVPFGELLRDRRDRGRAAVLQAGRCACRCWPACVLPGKKAAESARGRKKAAPAAGTKIGVRRRPGHPPGRRVRRPHRPRRGRRRLSRPGAENPAGRRDLDHPAARERRLVRAGAPAASRHQGPSPPQGRPAGHPRPAGRRRPLGTRHRAHLRPQQGRQPRRHHLPVVRLPGHRHHRGHPGPRRRRRPGPGHHRPAPPPPPSSPATPPAGPSSRPSPTPATSPAPARPATAPPAPPGAPSRSPCSCTP